MTTLRDARSTRADRALIAVCALVIGLSCALILTFDHGRDQGIYALVARTILEGGLPYRDAWDFKPPGIYFVYALARAAFGAGAHAIRIVEVAGLLATLAAMVLLARRFWGDWRVGLGAAAMSALVHAQLDFWHTAQPETFGGMLTIAALAVGAMRQPRGWRLLIAGALFGIAALMKPPLGGGGLVLALWAAHRAEHRKWLPVAWVGLGGVLSVAACALWFALGSGLDALYQALFVFTPHYTAIGWSGTGTIFTMLYHAASEWLTLYSSLLCAGLLLALAGYPAMARREAIGLLLGIIALQLVGVALQGKFFAYHYGAIWPLTALVAALGWARAWRWAAGRRLALAGVGLAMIAAAALRTATRDVDDGFWLRAWTRLWDRSPAARDRLASIADVDAAANRRVAHELSRRVAPGQPIYVWGFEPGLYDLADRPAASRYIYNVPQRVAWNAEAARAELMAELGAHPPGAVVIADADPLPLVTGNAATSREVLEQDFAALRGWLTAGYGPLMHVGDFEIWLRRPDPP